MCVYIYNCLWVVFWFYLYVGYGDGEVIVRICMVDVNDIKCNVIILELLNKCF